MIRSWNFPQLALRGLALLVGLGAASAASIHAAQLMEGMSGIKAYQIQFDGRVIGRVVVVGCDNPNPPPGYAAGLEYWSWNKGAAWRGSFTLVPVEVVPLHSAFSWTTFPHQHFNLSRTVPMPAIDPAAGDRFYEVEVREGTQWTSRGFMWLKVGRPQAQAWYGRNLTSDLVGDGSRIRFTSAEPPPQGSEDVFLLIP